MDAADFSGAAPGLLVNDKRGEQCPKIRQIKCKTLVEPCPNGAATHFIERLAVPPSVHVRFAETERAEDEDAPKKAGVMHLYVPRSRAVDLNVRDREKFGQHILGSRHMNLPIALSASPSIKDRVRDGDKFGRYPRSLLISPQRLPSLQSWFTAAPVRQSDGFVPR